MLRKAATAVVCLFSLFKAVGLPSAFQSNLRLMQLVPPESQIVGGMLGSTPTRNLPGLLVATRNNRIDIEDFFAVTGADTSRTIRQLVFVAAPGQRGMMNQHSLLVSGRFNQGSISRFVESVKGSTEIYRNLTVLVVPPFAREAGSFDEMRWLIVLNSQIVIFGSPSSVREELDRWLAKSPPSSSLIDRLGRLGSEDEAWCLMPAPSSHGVVQEMLGKLDSKLGTVARRGEPMEYGIHFGRRIEITVSSEAPVQANAGFSTGTDESPVSGASYFFSQAASAKPESAEQVVVRVSQGKYQSWIAAFSQPDQNAKGEIR